VLGVDPISEHDLYVPLFPDAEFKHGYEEAQALLLEALAPLGPEYLAIVREAFAARWIDVHENSGKRSGAYSSGAYGTPPYILLNWSDQLRDTFTLAHELGHSGHSYLAMKHQPYVYGDYPIFTAEVASTLNEALLLDFLLRRTTDRSRRLFLLDYWLTQINDTVFRQTMFAEFEHRIHVLGEEGDTLTASRLGEIYLGLAREYWGPEVAFDPERSGRTWSRIPHFYYNYYVYQYATAYAAAAVIARRILDGEPGARERYLDFLRSGSSRYPVETLALAGVDVTTPAPVQGVMKLFSSLLDEVERLLAEGER
jgi:oligoendopeptidase F